MKRRRPSAWASDGNSPRASDRAYLRSATASVMPWNWLVGQAHAVDVLRRSVAGDRVAQAYLFYGPDGVGKRVAALALAQALECERRAEGEADACGQCVPCHKVQRMLHPDVRLHLAVPSSHQTSSVGEPTQAHLDDISARLRILAENPYAEISYRRRPDVSDPEKRANLQAFYSVARIREISRELRYAPVEGKLKVGILTDADTMRKEAANAFLKSLEEPTRQTVLILTSTRPDRLLPTIVSRCQLLRFGPLSAEAVERALLERAIATDPGAAAVIARMAAGSFTRAIELAQNEALAERRRLLVGFLRAAYRRRARDVDPLVQQLAGLSHEQLRDALDLLLGWIRDLVLARELGDGAPLVNIDQQKPISDFVARLPAARLDAMAALVEHASQLVTANCNTTLVLINLAESLAEAMRGRPREALY